MDIQRVETYMKRVAESETKTFTPVGDKLKVGLDLGTAYIVMVVLDEENNPIACEKQAADVLRDGVVVDYLGALNIVKALKAKLEQRIGKELVNCAIAMPAGTDDSVKTHTYVAEGAELEVTAVLDEPSAANAIYQISDGVIVDIGGGTTGLALLKDGKVVEIADEPTGGTHLTLVLSGNYHIPQACANTCRLTYFFLLAAFRIPFGNPPTAFLTVLPLFYLFYPSSRTFPRSPASVHLPFPALRNKRSRPKVSFHFHSSYLTHSHLL